MMRADARSGGRGPWGLLGMIAVVVAVEAAVARHELDLGSPDFGEWAWTGRAAAGPGARGAAVLVLGDSAAKHGIQPRILGPRLGRPAWNLALSGGSPPISYLLLRRALRAGARPGAIVATFHADFFTLPAASYAPLWAGLLDAREAAELAWSARDASLLARLVLPGHVPSLRARPVIREQWAAWASGRPDPRRDRSRALRRNWSANRGGYVAAADPAAVPAVGPEHDRLLAPRPADPLMADYARRFFALAAAHDLPVYWVVPPHLPALEALRRSRGGDAAYDRLLASALARWPCLVVLDARGAGYDPASFVDPIHLNRLGASILSADLASALRHPPAGPDPRSRWLRLPAHAGRRPAEALEDFLGSYLAVRGRRVVK